MNVAPKESVLVVWNPAAGAAGQAHSVRHELERRQFTIREAASARHATDIAAQAAENRVGLVIAAGGDGTVNAVINGLSADFSAATLGVLPLGTGNDLCKTLAIPSDPLQALAAVDAGACRAIDLVRVESAAGRSRFVNMAAGGNSGRVVAEVSAEMKQRWGPLCYLRGAAAIIGDLVAYDTAIRLDDGPMQRFSILNVVLANGRTSAGGLHVGPRANPEDGLLDVVLILDGTPADLADLAMRFLVSDYLESESVILRRARRVSIEAQPPILFSADGDVLTDEPVTFTVEPKALRVVVGPDYAPDRGLCIPPHAPQTP